MSKVLITGASGFIGNNLINYLQNKTIQVLPFSRNLGMEYSQIDTSYLNNEDVEVIIHLAGKAHDLKKVASDADYYLVNTDLTKDIINAFLASDAKVFIFLSSVKAVADEVKEILTEDYIPNPITHYGKSKLLAEQYILSKPIPIGKRIYILRPCMIHGPGNKGNLNLLYNFVSKGLPWPLGSFENKRSFCSIDNLSFIISNLIENHQIPSGIYNISDDEPVSTNDLIRLIAESQAKKPFILNIPKSIVIILSKLGNIFKLPLNTERLNKLTETYIVSNNKIVQALNTSLPVSSKEGLIKTLNTFENSKSH
jgi:nucleoside-diphosphate-sugar epimerase